MADTIAAGLTSFWLGTRELNLAELERYYDGTQTVADNGMLSADQAAQADVTRFFKPVNYVAAVVDEPVGYLANGRIRITAGENERLEAWASDYYHRRIAPRLDDIVRWQALYGEAYLYLWTDREGSSRGLKVEALAPIEGGSKRVQADYGGQDAEELTAAVLYKRVPVNSKGGFDEYRITVNAQTVKVEKRELQGASQATYSRWELVSEEPNAAKVLPVIPAFNPIASDVLNMLPIQDDLDKLHLDMRMAREYSGFPTWAVDGPDPGPTLKVGPGRILFGGNYQHFPAPSVEPFLEERKALLESAAKITKSLTLLTETGTAPSGIALQYRQQAFLERLNGKAQRLETALALALRTAARILAVDSELYGIETGRVKDAPSAQELASVEFDVTLEPNVPSDELGAAQIADLWLNRLGVSRETAFGKAGVEHPLEEIERAEGERDADLAVTDEEDAEGE